jgi:hypothetical protein
MAQTIIVDIDQDAKTTITTKGFQGKACMDATAELEQAMGMKTDDRKTPEYDLREVQQTGH